MIKRLVALLLAILCLGCANAAVAHQTKEAHWADLERCLFGKEKTKADRVGALRELELASALALDQFNERDGWMLDELNQFKVPGIPKTIDEINLHTSPNIHQKYTHKGWNKDYNKDDLAKWNVRKTLLMNTVDDVFNFRASSSTWLGAIFRTENKEQHESFAALIYYVHILGDLEEVTNHSRANGLFIPLGTAHPGRDNPDLLYDLDKYLSILFEQQQNTPLYQEFRRKLEVLTKEIRSVERPKSDAELVVYKEYGKKLQVLLENYIPQLLKNEQFFCEVFP